MCRSHAYTLQTGAENTRHVRRRRQGARVFQQTFRKLLKKKRHQPLNMVGTREISSPHYSLMIILTVITSFASVLSSLTGSFHPSFMEEYAGELLMALQKQDGGLRPILCGEIRRRCFASLAVNATPVRNEAAKLFPSTYDNFSQTAGIRDGASHCAKILSGFYDNLETTSDLNDPEVIIKIDISNAFNSTCRALTLDVLSGYASRASNKKTLLTHARPYLICLVTSKPCAHAMLSYDTLTGTDRFTSRRPKRGDSRGTP